MKNFVKKMMEQHARVVTSLRNYEQFKRNAINDNKSSKKTVANIALIVRDLQNLADDLEYCLNNEGIQFAPNGTYFKQVACIGGMCNECKEDNPDNN